MDTLTWNMVDDRCLINIEQTCGIVAAGCLVDFCFGDVTVSRYIIHSVSSNVQHDLRGQYLQAVASLQHYNLWVPLTPLLHLN